MIPYNAERIMNYKFKQMRVEDTLVRRVFPAVSMKMILDSPGPHRSQCD